MMTDFISDKRLSILGMPPRSLFFEQQFRPCSGVNTMDFKLAISDLVRHIVRIRYGEKMFFKLSKIY
jgi:hypothetical protein